MFVSKETESCFHLETEGKEVPLVFVITNVSFTLFLLYFR